MGDRPPARDWLRRIVRARSGQVALYWFSVLEAAFVPIPFETVLAPYMQMRRDILWRLAGIGVAGYLTVALLGWGLGAVVHEGFADRVVDTFGWRDSYEATRARFDTGGFLVMTLLVALPIPTMVVHIGAGAAGVPFEQVIVAVLLVRGARYFGTGVLVYVYGDRVVAWFRARAAARRQSDERRPPRR